MSTPSNMIGKRGPDKSPRRPRRKKRPVGKQRGRALSELQKETLVQVFALTNSYTETAKQTGLSLGTVSKYVRLTPPAELARRRASTQYELAGKFLGKTTEVLDSITPESLDKASLGQKALAAGIFADKVVNLQTNAREMEQTSAGQSMFTPQSVAEMIKIIREKAGSMTFLDIKFKDEHPELVKQIDALEVQAEVVRAEPETVQSEDEFDGFAVHTPAPAGPMESD